MVHNCIGTHDDWTANKPVNKPPGISIFRNRFNLRHKHNAQNIRVSTRKACEAGVVMVKLFGKGKEEKKADEEFQKELAISEQHPPPGQMLSEDYVNSLGRSVYMVMDPDVMQIIGEVPQLKSFRIATSHLNRLTRKDKAAMMLDTLDADYLVLINKINANEDDYENGLWAIYEALRMFMRNANCDNIDGFKARIVTEQIKIVKAELEKPKRKVLPF